MKNAYLVPLSQINDERGSLLSMEGMKNVPFEIKRVYFLYNANSQASRGYHAHKELKQIVVCLRGSCSFKIDDGTDVEHHTLNISPVGLYIGSSIWREMHDFSADCVLAVIASHYYDEADYIRDYKSFKESKT